MQELPLDGCAAAKCKNLADLSPSHSATTLGQMRAIVRDSGQPAAQSSMSRGGVPLRLCLARIEEDAVRSVAVEFRTWRLSWLNVFASGTASVSRVFCVVGPKESLLPTSLLSLCGLELRILNAEVVWTKVAEPTLRDLSGMERGW